MQNIYRAILRLRFWLTSLEIEASLDVKSTMGISGEGTGTAKEERGSRSSGIRKEERIFAKDYSLESFLEVLP